MVLIERDLTIEPPRVPTDVDFRRAFLRPEDAGAYAAYRPDRDRERVLARLERGSMCHVAWLDGRIVSDCWYQPGEAWVEDLDRRFELGADEAYAYDAHTEPELRGHAVTPSRATLAATDLRDRGFTRAVGFVVPENGPGLRSPRKSGWTRFGVAGHRALRAGASRVRPHRAGGHPLAAPQAALGQAWAARAGARRPLREPAAEAPTTLLPRCRAARSRRNSFAASARSASRPPRRPSAGDG